MMERRNQGRKWYKSLVEKSWRVVSWEASKELDDNFRLETDDETEK
jgi:hypothetical protein